MATAAPSDFDFLNRHRGVWDFRPELRAVYHRLFDQLLSLSAGRAPIVELGAGPGFFKEYRPELIATDVIPSRWVDVVCDGCAMPFQSSSVGAIVMLDVLHHLPQPLDFMTEARRVLAPGGVVAMIEPWISPASYLLYRYFHHEDCTLGIDIKQPFLSTGKKAFDGNATIPYNLVRHYRKAGTSAPLSLVRLEPFLAFDYLATLGFKRTKPIPESVVQAAASFEKFLGPIGRLNATRAVILWQKQ